MTTSQRDDSNDRGEHGPRGNQSDDIRFDTGDEDRMINQPSETPTPWTVEADQESVDALIENAESEREKRREAGNATTRSDLQRPTARRDSKDAKGSNKSAASTSSTSSSSTSASKPQGDTSSKS